MSESKKLTLSFEEVCNVARALNENILENKNRVKENRIQTDHYIRKTFNISRKNFNFTAKGFGIQFNFTSGLYDIPQQVNQTTTEVVTSNVIYGSEKINQLQAAKDQEVNYIDTESIPISNKEAEQVLPLSFYELSQEFNKILSLTDEVKEMLYWYREHNDKKLIENAEINLNNDKLSGEVVTRSFKMYRTVGEDFSAFASSRKESIKDLISLALIEFMQKYKK